MDIETLELLEEVVANYAGTVILVSHDRDFVNNCVSSCLYFDGTGHITQIVGGYDDVDSYLEYKDKQRQAMAPSVKKVKAEEKVAEVKEKIELTTKKKLSYKEQRELESLPGVIDELENQIADFQEQVNSADFFNQSSEQTHTILNQLAISESKLEVAYARWQELDD